MNPLPQIIGGQEIRIPLKSVYVLDGMYLLTRPKVLLYFGEVSTSQIPQSTAFPLEGCEFIEGLDRWGVESAEGPDIPYVIATNRPTVMSFQRSCLPQFPPVSRLQPPASLLPPPSSRLQPPASRIQPPASRLHPFPVSQGASASLNESVNFRRGAAGGRWSMAIDCPFMETFR